MKLLGLSFGRKMANTEILVKEALMGAEELGVEVGIVRVTGLKILEQRMQKEGKELPGLLEEYKGYREIVKY